jgi:hypothetical protein
MAHKKNRRSSHADHPPETTGRKWLPFVVIGVVFIGALVVLEITHQQHQVQEVLPAASAEQSPLLDSTSVQGWTARAIAVSRQFHRAYTACWEGAYGALGDAYLYRVTRDSSVARFHLLDHPLQRMCDGTWVDDRAWVCLAELEWWKATGKTNASLIADAVRRYNEARSEGRLSNHEGFWSWYNWPPGAKVTEKIFTNSNMNQMVTVACGLYEATGEKRYLQDALLVWKGDAKDGGIERQWYAGNGRWKGKTGHVAFGHELPWEGTGYCSVASALYRITGDRHYQDVAVQTARRILDPVNGWVDPQDYYQLRMDGNGAFIHFLFDAFEVAPKELAEVPEKVEKMLQHVWSNHNGTSTVTLHRLPDHGIRNGWNPRGGEEGYGVGEIGTVHAQGEAARAFGVFVYYRFHMRGSQ